VTVKLAPTPHVSRELEWAAALILFAWGTALLMPGETFSRPTMAGFAAIGRETTWGLVTVGIAAFRMLGLWINGNWYRSPTLRFATALVGAGLWIFMGLAFSHDGYPGTPTGEHVCLMLACLDVYSALRSARDQSRNDRRAAIARKGV
jgi:hypothetical protein